MLQNKAKERHFANSNHDIILLHVDSYQWEKLNEFDKVIPRVIIHEEFADFIIACGFEMNMIGLTGWIESLTSNQKKSNSMCTELDSTASAFKKALEIDEDSKNNNYVMINPAMDPRASLFEALSAAPRDLDAGVELMIDCTYFRSTVDDDFQDFFR